jgi:hypothetical protein
LSVKTSTTPQTPSSEAFGRRWSKENKKTFRHQGKSHLLRFCVAIRANDD